MEKTISTQLLVRENNLERDGFRGWVFEKGMLFNSRKAWWGARGERNRPHEGLDFLLYRNKLGRDVRLGRETRIPVLYDGVVVSIVNDFLGKSVMVAHQIRDHGRIFLSIYGHTAPTDRIRIGKILEKGEIIGTLADTRNSRSKIYPHLHLSLGWISNENLSPDLDWNKISDPKIVTLIDPLTVTDDPYHLAKN